MTVFGKPSQAFLNEEEEGSKKRLPFHHDTDETNEFTPGATGGPSTPGRLEERSSDKLNAAWASSYSRE